MLVNHSSAVPILRPSYLHNDFSYIGKTALYQIGAQAFASRGVSA